MKGTPSKTQRLKRSNHPFEVEIFFVIDYGLWYDQTQPNVSLALSKIKQFYAFVLNAMNIRYKSLTINGRPISLRYAGIYIADTPEAARFVEYEVEQHYTWNNRKAFLAEKVLPVFETWARINLAAYNYDHAMMFSYYEMGRNDAGSFNPLTAGLSRIGSTCQFYKYSIVEDHFDAIIGTVAARTLGLNLGARPDGNENPCLASDGYIMAPSYNASSTKQFKFSTCSATAITTYIDLLNSKNLNCLDILTANYNTSDQEPYVSDLAGQTYPPDNQCQYLEGTMSSLNRAYYNGNYSGICMGKMACIKSDSSGFSLYLAWEGTTCGNGTRLARSGTHQEHFSTVQKHVNRL
ncbi:uncharacterized protein LOC127878653 [Dreissena polymorpha]|uniref:uncharacterized protein LOC127878653 n=1 Tax=Dreissena polymorpha TaxID=45954 RepID=UPI0022652D8F|nr:uncharacterized protein LOC127878653 [Dreissena polymorpha]